MAVGAGAPTPLCSSPRAARRNSLCALRARRSDRTPRVRSEARGARPARACGARRHGSRARRPPPAVPGRPQRTRRRQHCRPGRARPAGRARDLASSRMSRDSLAASVAVAHAPCVHLQANGRHPHQHHAPGNAGGGAACRRRAGTARRAQRDARAGGQHLPRAGRARAARHAVRVRRHRPRARGVPARGGHLGVPAVHAGKAAADRADDPRGRHGAGAGRQGPDRHQGRAPVDAGQPRGPDARVPAAGSAHRHLAADRGRDGARATARAAATAGAAGRERRIHHPHQRRGRDRGRPGQRPPVPERAVDPDRGAARDQHGPGAAVPGTVARAARSCATSPPKRRRRSRSTRARTSRSCRRSRGSSFPASRRSSSTTPASGRCSTCTRSTARSRRRSDAASSSSPAAT